MKQKIEIEVDIPEGWEATGEYRRLNPGEHFASSKGIARGYLDPHVGHRCIIIRKKEPLAVQLAKAVMVCSQGLVIPQPHGNAWRLAQKVIAEYENGGGK